MLTYQGQASNMTRSQKLAGTFEVYDLPSTRISCKKTRILKRSSVNSCYPPSQRSVSNFPSLWEAPQGSELIAGIDNS